MSLSVRRVKTPLPQAQLSGIGPCSSNDCYEGIYNAINNLASKKYKNGRNIYGGRTVLSLFSGEAAAEFYIINKLNEHLAEDKKINKLICLDTGVKEDRINKVISEFEQIKVTVFYLTSWEELFKVYFPNSYDFSYDSKNKPKKLEVKAFKDYYNKYKDLQFSTFPENDFTGAHVQDLFAVMMINRGSTILDETGKNIVELGTKIDRDVWLIIRRIFDTRGRTPHFVCVDNFITNNPNNGTAGVMDSEEYIEALKRRTIEKAGKILTNCKMFGDDENSCRESFKRVSEFFKFFVD